MTKLSESIIGKIKCEHIAPVPKWHFLFRGYAFWALFVSSVILGSLSFSVIVHIANTGDLDIFKHFNGNIFTSAVMLLPYFWLFSLGIFAIVAYFNWRCTRQGYRFRRRWILLGSVCLSVFFGSIFYVLGMGNEIDKLMVKAMPFYDQSKHRARNELWLRPEIGLIMGKVVSVDNINNQLTIQDGQGKNWEVEEEFVVPSLDEPIKKGKIIKIIGKKKGDNKFVANQIRKCGDCQDDEDVENENKKELDKDGIKKEELKFVKSEDDDKKENENKKRDENEDEDEEDSRFRD